MGIASRAIGIDVAVHSTDAGCGDPCHPGNPCIACQPFWQTMLDTGRFKAYVPPTFAGEPQLHKPNFSAPQLDFASLSFRTRGSNS